MHRGESGTAFFPCTWPGCHRGPANPFSGAGRLANHRFAAHGIRSSNEESIARQARRDRKRAQVKGTPPPEYIDVEVIEAAVKQFLPINMPPQIREGNLDLGEREQLRRRLCHFLVRWMYEFRRTPADIAVAIVQMGACGFAPPPKFIGEAASEMVMLNLARLLNSRSLSLEDSDASDAPCVAVAGA